VLADDHSVVRAGLKLLLESIPGVRVVGEAGSGLELLELASQFQPDLVVTDLVMPEMDGLQAVTHLKRRPLCPKILVLTMRAEPEIARTLIEAGADGYLVKDCPPWELSQAMQAMGAGFSYYSPSVARRLLTGGEQHPRNALTSRQLEILRMIGLGLANKEIGFELGLSPKTVAVHRARIMKRLGIFDLSGLVLYCVRQGLVDASRRGPPKPVIDTAQ
jgi:DNA-binding NarL/FixJ family response regulator